MDGLLKRAAKRLFERLSAEGRELARLKRAKRNVAGTSSLPGFRFRYADPVSFAWQFSDIFQRQIYRFNPTSQKPFIIDCGANVGVSVAYFSKHFPGAEILAFEPDPHLFSILSENVGNINSVRLINKGVWRENGTMAFYSDGADGGRIADHTDPSRTQVTVQVERLATHLARPVDFLKLDIEGAEGAVIKDCEHMLANVRNAFIEYHSSVGKPQELGQILEILSRSGFRYFLESATIHSRRPFLQRESRDGYDNLINIYGCR